MPTTRADHNEHDIRGTSGDDDIVVNRKSTTGTKGTTLGIAKRRRAQAGMVINGESTTACPAPASHNHTRDQNPPRFRCAQRCDDRPQGPSDDWGKN
jgi:hypothetical protein